MSTEINLLNGRHAYSLQDCVPEDSDHVWCDGVWLCKEFRSCQWITVPYLQRQAVQEEAFGPKDEDTVIL